MVRSGGGTARGQNRSRRRGPRLAGPTMTDLHTSVAMNRVASRIEAWADRERGLAAGLAGRRPPLLPRDGIGLAIRPRSLTDLAPLTPPKDRAHGPTSGGDSGLPTTALAAPVPTAQLVVPPPPRGQPASVPTHTPVPDPTPPIDYDYGSDLAFHANTDGAPSPGVFDDLVQTLNGAAVPARPLPSADRFRVRVARVAKPHRATKRDYNYFEELDAALAIRVERSDPMKG